MHIPESYMLQQDGPNSRKLSLQKESRIIKTNEDITETTKRVKISFSNVSKTNMTQNQLKPEAAIPILQFLQSESTVQKPIAPNDTIISRTPKPIDSAQVSTAFTTPNILSPDQ